MNTHHCRLWLSGALVAALAAVPRPAMTQQLLDEENRYSFQLRDGTQVVALGAAPALGVRTPTNSYYYLPAGLRLSRRADGTPEFLFLKYTTDSGGVQGGLIHFLMEWGLTQEQQRELGQLLARARPGAQLMGAAQVGVGGDNGSFRIISATLSNSTRTRSMVKSSTAPNLPGARVAVAADLDAAGAGLLDASFGRSRSISDVSLELALTYRTLVPAARGRIVMNWTKLIHSYDSLTAQYGRTETSTRRTEDCLWFICVSSSRPQYSYSYDEYRRQYDFMLDKRVITLDFDETVSDDRVTKIREAFFQYFLEAFAQKADEETPVAPSDTAAAPDIRHGNRYTYKRVIRRDVQQTRVDTFELNYRLAFNSPISLTGNLASWYDGVRHDPRAVAEVNVSNPFFESYSPMFRVDFDAPKELFSSAINYVTLTLRKQRPEGAPFQRSVTIDENYVRDRGVLASFTYARGSDANPADFEYRVQWSLKGGQLFPALPVWQHSNAMQAVTLVPPVVPRRIEFEGDLEALKAARITRVVAQVHYKQFGREVEENIQLPVAGAEPLVSKTIFTDRDARGYAYRLVIHHQQEGRLALPWSAKVGDDYIYAGIPETLLTVAEVLQAARDSATTIAGSAARRVLDRFADVLGENR